MSKPKKRLYFLNQDRATNLPARTRTKPEQAPVLKNRLTKWDGDVPTYNGQFAGTDLPDDHPAWKAVNRHWRPINIKLEVLRRLAEYEDTGLTPKAIKALMKRAGQKLLDLTQKDIEHKLVELPVAAGDHLWQPGTQAGEPAAIKCTVQWISAFIAIDQTAKFMLQIESENGDIYEIPDRRIGENFFLDEISAIAAARKQLQPTG